MKDVFKVRVMTRGFIIDLLASIKNFLEMRINQYEDLVIKGKKEIWDELKKEKVNLKWFRYEISQLTNGAMVIMLYGEKK